MFSIRTITPLLLILVIGCAVASDDSFYHRNLKTIKAIYNLTEYPNQLPIIAHGISAVPPGLFNLNVVGRINPFGNFTGANLSIEYFYALIPNPNTNLAGVGLGAADLVSFASSCPQVASSTVNIPMLAFKPPSFNVTLGTVGYLKHTVFWHFDHNGAVLKYDGILPSLAEALVPIVGNQSDPARQQFTISAICNTAQLICVGSNLQYANVSDCQTQLSAKAYGTFDDSWSDTVVCRYLHVTLARADPNVHCVHVGPTGGGKCVTYPYMNKYFLDDVQLFGNEHSFKCANPSC